MQRMAPNMPPRPNQSPNGNPHSPALGMAQRIQREQGTERAKQYLMAMEPYLAPAERAYIAEQIGVTLPLQSAQPVYAPPSPPAQSFAPPPAQTFAPPQAQPFNGQGNPLAALGNLGGNGTANNPMQLLQMFSGMNGAKGGGLGGGLGGLGNMGNLMQMAQMMQSLGPMLGGKK